MNIDSALSQLISPPRISLPNYNPVSKNILKHFSKFNNSFLTFDSVNLRFKVFKNLDAKNTRKTLVIYTHTIGSCGDEGLPILDACYDLGVSLCLYDSRGCGASENANVTFGEKESVDLLYLLFYCGIIDGFTEFVLWGRSIGTCAVIQLTAKLTWEQMTRQGAQPDGETRTWLSQFGKLNLQEEFCKFMEVNGLVYAHEFRFNIVGLVLDSPLKSVPSSVEKLVCQNIANFDLLGKLASNYVQKWIKDKIGVDIWMNQSINLVSKISYLACFICSKNDEIVMYQDSMELYSAYGSQTLGDVKRLVNTECRHKEKRPSEALKEALNLLVMDEGRKKRKYVFTVVAERPSGINFSIYESRKSESTIMTNFDATKDTLTMDPRGLFTNINMRKDILQNDFRPTTTQPNFPPMTPKERMAPPFGMQSNSGQKQATGFHNVNTQSVPNIPQRQGSAVNLQQKTIPVSEENTLLYPALIPSQIAAAPSNMTVPPDSFRKQSNPNNQLIQTQQFFDKKKAPVAEEIKTDRVSNKIGLNSGESFLTSQTGGGDGPKVNSAVNPNMQRQREMSTNLNRPQSNQMASAQARFSDLYAVKIQPFNGGAQFPQHQQQQQPQPQKNLVYGRQEEFQRPPSIPPQKEVNNLYKKNVFGGPPSAPKPQAYTSVPTSNNPSRPTSQNKTQPQPFKGPIIFGDSQESLYQRAANINPNAFNAQQQKPTVNAYDNIRKSKGNLFESIQNDVVRQPNKPTVDQRLLETAPNSSTQQFPSYPQGVDPRNGIRPPPLAPLAPLNPHMHQREQDPRIAVTLPPTPKVGSQKPGNFGQFSENESIARDNIQQLNSRMQEHKYHGQGADQNPERYQNIKPGYTQQPDLPMVNLIRQRTQGNNPYTSHQFNFQGRQASLTQTQFQQQGAPPQPLSYGVQPQQYGTSSLNYELRK